MDFGCTGDSCIAREATYPVKEEFVLDAEKHTSSRAKSCEMASRARLYANPVKNKAKTRKISVVMSSGFPTRAVHRSVPSRPVYLRLLWLVSLLAVAIPVLAQNREDEIVANLAGGRVIVHVARDIIIFAAINHSVESDSVPPRVMGLDFTHIGVLLGASEWRLPADPKPIRMDRNFQRAGARDTRYQATPGEAETDLETIGTAFLEKLRPLAAQLHHKLDFSP